MTNRALPVAPPIPSRNRLSLIHGFLLPSAMRFSPTAASRYKLAIVPAGIRLRKNVADMMLEHARGNPREECCGLLAGLGGIITQIFPAQNAADSPATAYEIAPKELFSMMRAIRAAGLELLGIYHSHPACENRPSERDIERAYYPDAAYLIISSELQAQKPLRAFSIRGGRVSELDLKIQ